MKRDTAKNFRVQREAIDRQREEVQTVKADMQKEVHKVEAEMSRRFDSQREDMQAMHLKGPAHQKSHARWHTGSRCGTDRPLSI